MAANVEEVLRQISRRQRLVATANLATSLILILGTIYLLLLLASRLLALLPDWFGLHGLWIVPAAALLLALAFLVRRRQHIAQAARHLDREMGTKDLFLTTVGLQTAPGEYKALVSKAAQAQATKVELASVAPLRLSPRAGQACVALLLIGLGSLFLPQLDPFQLNKERRRLAQRTQELTEMRRRTAARAEVLREKEPEKEKSKEVDRALEQLMLSLRRMQPKAPKPNQARLAEHQKTLGNKWRKTSQAHPGAKSGDGLGQQFGGMSRKQFQKQQEWKRELRQGQPKGLEKEMQELRRQLDELKKLQDSGGSTAKETAERLGELQERIQDLAEFLRDNQSTKPLDAALARMLKQLQMARRDGLQGEACEAMGETLELSQLELEALAQAMRDMQALEEALRTLQLARRLNAKDPLDGKAAGACNSLAEYEAFYRSQLGMRNDQVGAGMKGPGTGQGGQAPEDPESKSNFQSEKSRSALTAGKILMELKSQQIGDDGKARVEYAAKIQEVKQGVSEAIQQEQVPPDYHEAIKKYFDTLGRKKKD